MVRILHIVGVMDVGGIEDLLMNVYRNIDRKKVQFDFVVHREQRGYYDDEIESLGGKIHRVASKKTNIILNTIQMKKVFSQSYNIAHIHISMGTSWHNVFLAKLYKIKNVIVHSHSCNCITSKKKMVLHNLMKKYISKNSTYRMACSLNAYEWMFSNWNDDTSFIISNGIDLNKYKLDLVEREKIRKEMGLEDKIVIGHVGRFDQYKNQHFLIELICDMRENEKIMLMLIGSGMKYEYIKQYVKECELDNRIIFMGLRKDVHKLLQAIDIAVFPSKVEGFGIAALEAQATGTKTIVSSSFPNEILITDSITKIKNLQDQDEWTSAIIKSIGNPKVDNVEVLMDKGYDIKHTAELLQKLYLSI